MSKHPIRGYVEIQCTYMSSSLVARYTHRKTTINMENEWQTPNFSGYIDTEYIYERTSCWYVSIEEQRQKSGNG